MQTKTKVNMFCFPPAGSGAVIYYPWKRHVAEWINIIPVEYPGHGAKVKQELINEPEVLAKVMLQDLSDSANQPFILFGHSVGAALLWRVVELLSPEQLSNLKLIVVSSRPEYEFIRDMPEKHALTQQDILGELKKYNNFPQEILNHQDTLNFFLKIIRNDFHLSDRMLHDHIAKKNIPLLAVYGVDDPDIPDIDCMNGWKNHSEKWLGAYALEGDHFYFRNEKSMHKMLGIISDAVSEIVEEAYG